VTTRHLVLVLALCAACWWTGHRQGRAYEILRNMPLVCGGLGEEE